MNFSPQSKVWVYQSDRKLSAQEVSEIQELLNRFTAKWTAHGYQLTAKAEIIYDYFIVIMADDKENFVSGCSISTSVSTIENIGMHYGIDFFNRYNMAYKVNGEVKVASKEDFETLISSHKIGLDTIVFNNLIQSLADFETKWEVALKDSWHKNIFAEQLAQ
jgi:hypothetical protein